MIDLGTLESTACTESAFTKPPVQRVSPVFALRRRHSSLAHTKKVGLYHARFLYRCTVELNLLKSIADLSISNTKSNLKTLSPSRRMSRSNQRAIRFCAIRSNVHSCGTETPPVGKRQWHFLRFGVSPGVRFVRCLATPCVLLRSG